MLQRRNSTQAFVAELLDNGHVGVALNQPLKRQIRQALRIKAGAFEPRSPASTQGVETVPGLDEVGAKRGPRKASADPAAAGKIGVAAVVE